MIPYTLYDPSGNITALAEDPGQYSDRASAAKQIMSAEPRCEQVGFIVPKQGAEDIRLCMAGGEFCGNAVFAAAVHFVINTADVNSETKIVRVASSGADETIDVSVTKEEGAFRCSYRFPALPKKTVTEGLDAVILPGITHCILWDPMPDEEAEKLVKELCVRTGSDAMGLMFLDAQRLKVRPLVYVRDPETLVWENSCASGSVAIASALTKYRKTPFSDTLSYPGGEIGIAVDETGRVTLTETIKIL